LLLLLLLLLWLLLLLGVSSRVLLSRATENDKTQQQTRELYQLEQLWQSVGA